MNNTNLTITDTNIINIENNKSIGVKQFKYVIDIFDHHNIDYWIEYGTLLGAVREKGIIPWDSEFDVGVWNEDYENNKACLIKEFEEYGFIINYSAKDRIKLIHQDWSIGIYSIDIHTYHIKNDIAFVSCAKKKYNIYNLIKYYLHRTLKIHDKRIKQKYPMHYILKTVINSQEKIPQALLFIRGKYNFPKSFIVVVNDNIYNNDICYLKSLTLLKRLGIYLISSFPAKAIYTLIDFIEKKGIKAEFTDDIQAFDVNYFKNIEKIKFENIMVSCPKKHIEYLENVYGRDWNIKKPKWKSSQMGIRKKLHNLNQS